MSKAVTFKNTSDRPVFVEVKPYAPFRENLDVFDNPYDECPQVSILDTLGFFMIDGKPYKYFRHYDVQNNVYRLANMMELGDTPVSVQKGAAHRDEIATRGTPVSGLKKLSDDPVVYGYSSEEKPYETRIHDKFVTSMDGDFLQLQSEPWPFTIYDHQSQCDKLSFAFQPSTWMGKFDGKPILGVGSFDMMFISKDAAVGSIPMGYLLLTAIGIREDGRKEYVAIVAGIVNNGKAEAVYILEGETPIVADTFTMEAEWVKLPYANDGTCVYKNAVFKFCGKEIHFEGKWGTKGFTPEPNFENPGESQVYGTFYEGKTPYNHRLSYVMTENRGAFDYNLREIGFDI